MTTLPEEAHLAALAALPAMGPARLASQLGDSTPLAAWQRVLRGRAIPPRGSRGAATVETWRAAAVETDVAELWAAHRSAGIGVLGTRSAAFPAWLAEDPDPPAVIFLDGDPAALAHRRVALVGTRACTRYGVDLAYELGAMLSAAGVSVVSGLAKGIDAAAHRGALDASGAPPVAVVGTGLDVAYPAENRRLWRAVAEAGVVLTEAPLGSRPERWRFPARNRIIAAAAEVVIVIESHDRGGSLYTAAQAVDRDRPVLAVPGPIRSPASAGCNRLLADGCAPLCEPDDALVAIGLCAPEREERHRVPITPDQQLVLGRLGWAPATLQDLCGDGPLPAIAARLEELVALGVVARRGPWFERTAVTVTPDGPNDPPMTTPRGDLPLPAP